MKIVQNLPSIDKSFGGPIFSTKIVAESLSNAGHDVTIVASKLKNDLNPIKFNKNVKVVLINSYTSFRYMLDWEKQ